ncbi:Expansin-B3 [Rhynchospora pubera]|uniref:Expansin-B3 n=1 Tax=Rhynchospora pubera TaxID=906938 RepID=A0AAV8EF82_9POAL|nr:Expansin-B3 [Rhynchospora pubera]
MASSSSLLGLAASLALLSLFTPSSCFDPTAISYNDSKVALSWQSGSATWYGAPTGAGPDDNGGGCGFKNVNLPPFSAMTSCGNHNLFKGGKGCGSCYYIKCLGHPACSGKPSHITITDLCDGGICLDAPFHFDMSGIAFGSMSYPGRSNELRHAGRLAVEFARVPCQYPGRTISFHVEQGSNPNYFAVLIEYEDGEGDLNQVEIMESRSRNWVTMRESWGAIYRLDTSRPLNAPFSIRLTDDKNRKLVARNVIPANWRPNTVYRSVVQYS